MNKILHEMTRENLIEEVLDLRSQCRELRAVNLHHMMLLADYMMYFGYIRKKEAMNEREETKVR